MVCGDVRRIIYFFLDGQLDERRQADIGGHLHLCHDCEERASIHRRLRIFIQKRLPRHDAPVHLKQRLIRSVRAFRAEWSNPH